MLVAVSLLAASTASAQDEPELAIIEPEQRGVIQNRRYKLLAEIGLTGGVLPLDPFYRSLHIGGRAALHLGDHFALEAGVLYAFNVPTDLRTQLRDNFAVDDQRPGVEQPLFLVDGGFIIKPFYGKLSLFNRRLIYNEISVFLGGGVAGYNGRDAFLPLGGPGAGAGVRVFINEVISFRVDMRHYVFFGVAPNADLDLPAELLIENVMNISFGVSINFGGA